jgi:hypothetical protein
MRAINTNATKRSGLYETKNTSNGKQVQIPQVFLYYVFELYVRGKHGCDVISSKLVNK